MEQDQAQPSSPVPVSNDSLMPHAEPHEGNSLPAQAGQIIQPSVISEAPTELRDVISISKRDLGLIAEPKGKKLPVVVIVVVALVGLFILYEYMLYKSLVAK